MGEYFELANSEKNMKDLIRIVAIIPRPPYLRVSFGWIEGSNTFGIRVSYYFVIIMKQKFFIGKKDCRNHWMKKFNWKFKQI